MKLVKKYINEKFSEESDPIEDMNIGLKYLIQKFLENLIKEYPIASFNKEMFVINDDLTIDVKGRFDISYRTIIIVP
jgi:hypothetical protein